MERQSAPILVVPLVAIIVAAGGAALFTALTDGTQCSGAATVDVDPP